MFITAKKSFRKGGMTGERTLLHLSEEPSSQEGKIQKTWMVQTQSASPAGGANREGVEEKYIYRLGIYGWRKHSLYLVVILMLSILVINFALTVWILKVTCLNTEGMGQLRIRPDRVKLDGVSEFLSPLFAQEIGSKRDTSLLVHSETHNVSIKSINRRGGVSSSLTLGPQSIEITGKHFEVMSNTGRRLFSAGLEHCVVGVGKLMVTGADGAECDHSIETPLIRAEGSTHLSLEAPTRSLYMDAPKGVHISAESGSTEAQSSTDISLRSTDGTLVLDAECVRLPRLPATGQAEGSGEEELFEVCVCPDGRLYTSKAGPTSTCHEYSGKC